MSSIRTFRQTVFKIHEYVGAYLLIFMLLIFATGFLTLFQDEIELIGQPGLFVAGAEADREADFGAFYDRVRADQPEARVLVLALTPRPWLGDKARIRDKVNGPRTIWFDPRSGEKMGVTGRRAAAIPEAIRKIHVQMLMPGPIVRLLVPAMSIFLLISITSGLITYRRFWKGLLRVPSATADARARAGAWHRLIALWILPFLLIVALTSAVFMFNNLGFGPRFARPEAVTAREGPLPDAFSGSDLNAAIAIARAQMPMLHVDSIVLPSVRSEPIIMNGINRAQGRLLGRLTVLIDPTGPRLLAINAGSTGNLMAKISPLASQVHFGTFAGWATVPLWAIFGLAAIALLGEATKIRSARFRSVSERQGDKTQGVLRGFVRSLGPVRWGYLAIVLAVAALAVRHIL